MTIRILHVLGGMNCGGVETWLMHVLRHIDRSQFKVDFLVHTEQPCAYDSEIRALGSKIIPCLHPSSPRLYAQNFKQLLKKHGPYDIIHSHVHHFSGYVLRLAAELGISVRVAHSHNDTSPMKAQASFLRRWYLNLMSRWIQQYATLGLACSKDAAKDLYGVRWQTDSRWQVLYYGIDLSPFIKGADTQSSRSELGISEDAFVVGHVGRFAQQKNHQFLIDIAIEALKHEPNIYFLFVGDGPLRPAVERQVKAAGLTEQIIFTGVRRDVASLMLGAMNVFAFPSLYEGLGLVLVEAQAAGLPCVISDSLPKDGVIIKGLIHRLSLTQSASTWAEAILSAKHNTPVLARIESLKAVQNSSFNIQTSTKALETLYEKAVSY